MSFYSDLSQYYDDFKVLKEMKTLLLEEVNRLNQDPTDTVHSEVTRGFFTETSDGREMRVILPNGINVLNEYLPALLSRSTDDEDVNVLHNTHSATSLCKGLEFVGFFGKKRKTVSEEKQQEIWMMDKILVGELAQIDSMLAYVTGEVEKGGDYANLVLFRDKGAVQALQRSPHHHKAVSSISPQFYTKVHIHSGRLREGLMSPFFELQKTLFLCFTLPPEHPGYRRVQLWRACREGSDDVNILPVTSSVVG